TNGHKSSITIGVPLCAPPKTRAIIALIPRLPHHCTLKRSSDFITRSLQCCPYQARRLASAALPFGTSRMNVLQAISTCSKGTRRAFPKTDDGVKEPLCVRGPCKFSYINEALAGANGFLGKRSIDAFGSVTAGLGVSSIREAAAPAKLA